MPIYRYRFVAFDAAEIPEEVPGAVSFSDIGVSTYVDISAPVLSKEDLDAFMLERGFEFSSTSPVNSPSEEAAEESGFVIGTGPSVDNQVAVYVGSDGYTIEASPVTIDNSGNVTIPGTLNASVGGDLSGTLPNPTVADLTIAGEVQGSVLYFNGTNWVHLAPGTALQFLQTQGVGFNPNWASATSLTAVAPVNVTKSAAVIGVATTAARSDHKHDITTAVPSTIGNANTEGVATTLARSNHIHALGGTVGGDLLGTLPNPTVRDLTITGETQGSVLYFNGTNWVRLSPGTAGNFLQTQGIGFNPVWTPGVGLTSTLPVNVTKSAAVVGVATTAARSDHKHDITTAAPSTIGNANVEGVATSLARSNHIHALGGTVNGDLSGTLPNPTVKDLTITGETQGSVLYFNGTNWVRLSPGTSGHTLTTNGVGFNPSWAPSSGGLDGIDGILLVSATDTVRYATIALAIAASSPGDNIWLGPGNYAESFTLPNDVTMRGSAGTRITGAAATGTRIILGDRCSILSIAVDLPTDATAAISYAGSFPVALTTIIFTGKGGSGIGFQKSGGFTGSATLFACVYTSGTADSFIDVSAGAVVATGCQVQFGTLTNALRMSGGVLVTEAFLLGGLSTITNGVLISGGSFIGGETSLEGPVNALHVTANGANIQLKSCSLNSSTYDVLIDPAVTTGVLQFTAVSFQENKLSWSGTYAAIANILLTFQDQDLIFEADAAFRTWGEFHVGSAERGQEFTAGEGDSYVRGMVVITSDGTATSTTEGGNLTDVSIIAASPSASSFSFQGVTAGHTIMIGSSLANATDTLKHFGIRISTTTAGVPVLVTDTPFVFEIWNGSAWAEVGGMSVSHHYHRYSNKHMIRSGSHEHIRYGIDIDTTWVSKTINGDDLYWSRVRIATTVTTAPVFERFKISPNRFAVNNDGTNSYYGRSRFKQTIQGVGNVFGESGGVTNFNFAVGSGGFHTGWNQQIKNSQLNGILDTIYIQFVIPKGTDTSFPISFRILYIPTVTGSNDVEMYLSAKVLEVSGNLIADPAGGAIPIPRTLANTTTTTATPGTEFLVAGINSSVGTKIQSIIFGPFNIQKFYEGDLVVVALELHDDGVGNADIGIVSMEIDGAKWTHGSKL